MEPEDSIPHSKEPINNPLPVRINPIPHIHTYYFKIHSNTVLPSMSRPSLNSFINLYLLNISHYNKKENKKSPFPVRLPVKTLTALQCPGHLNLLDLINKYYQRYKLIARRTCSQILLACVLPLRGEPYPHNDKLVNF